MRERTASIVIVIFSLTVCTALLLPVVSRVMHPEAPPLPEKLSSGLVHLVDVMIAAVVFWLGGKVGGTDGVAQR